ncbi:hypothetical protein BsWGS_16386 [Bradybaena similaris]
MTCAWLFLAVLLTVLDSTVSELEICDDAYQQLLTYSGIWKDVRAVKKFTSDYDYPGRLSPKYLREYAKYICRVVNPLALINFRSKMAGCQNMEQITALVEENRGFCSGTRLNARVKQSIIDRLSPVLGGHNHACLTISDNSVCDSAVADKLKEKRLPVSSFRNETDKFFDSIWECQLNLFKSHSSSCPDWQLPFLLSLDTMDVPALFRVRLTDQQIAMLELNKAAPTSTRKKKNKNKKKKMKALLKKNKKGRKAKKVKLLITIEKPKKTKKVTYKISNRAKSGRKSG